MGRLIDRGALFAFVCACLWLNTADAQFDQAEQGSNSYSSRNEPTFSERETLEIVVSANRVETERRRVGSSISVIDGREIADSQLSTVREILRGVPGIDVVQSGTGGGNSAIFIRGANSEHTLVLIDGIEINNPISPNRAYNFVDLSLDNIERIEVLRGPQSVLYGSDAIGGVVNIITKRGRGAASLEASAEGGSYETLIEKANVSGGSDVYDYSFGVSRQDIGGISAAATKAGNSEDDRYENTSLSLNSAVRPLEALEARAFLRYTNSSSDIDNFGGPGGDDPNRAFDNEQLFARAQLKAESITDQLEHVLGISYSRHEFSDDNDPDELHPADSLRSDYTGWIRKADLQNIFKLSENARITLGLENEEENGDSYYFSDGEFGPFEDRFSRSSATTNGYYTQAEVSFLERVFLVGGIRADDHSRFGTAVTWRLAQTVLVPESGSKLFATVGTGFKAPSLAQLYSSFGNENLDEERSIGVDAGIEQEIIKGILNAGATYFYNEFDDLITFEPNTFIFENISEARSSGLEGFVEVSPLDNTTIRASYTYTDTEDKDTGASLLRRARNKLAAQVAVTLTDKLQVSSELQYYGTRFDNDFSTFPASRTSLGSYTLLSLRAAYDITENLQIFARVDNLLDQDYEEVFGYGTTGVAGYGGLRVRL